MQYNSESNNQDCVSEILKICGATTATFPINDITRRFNSSLDAYFDLAFEADKHWPFDDVNQTSAAIVTQNLVSGTNSYLISAFTGSPIGVLGVNILDGGGNEQPLEAEEFNEATFYKDYDTTNTGQPTKYMKYGNLIYLRPTPDYTIASGLRAFVDREPLYMSVTDTNKVPGIPKKHHMYLCRMTALPYLVEHNLPQAIPVSQLIRKDEQDITRFYSRRDEDMVHRFEAFKQDNR